MADRRSRVRVGQLMVAQVALAGVAVATTGPAWVLTGVAAAAAAVLIGTFGRTGDRWWYEAVAGQHRFRRRRQVAAAHVVAAAVDGRPGPPHLAWLRTLAPGLSLRSVDLGGATVGVGQDPYGWFAAAEVGSLWDDDRDDELSGGAEVPYADLATLIEAGPDRPPVSIVQVAAVPAGTAIRPAWVAVRISPAQAVTIERAGGEAAVLRAVATAAQRAARTLDRHGWPARALDPAGLLAALVEATGLDGPPQEHWKTWRSGRLVHTCYEVSGWEPARGMLAPGVRRIVVAFSAAEPTILALVTGETSTLARICREVTRSVEGTGLRLRRLDGDQAPAMYACAPTGVSAAHLDGRSPRRGPARRLGFGPEGRPRPGGRILGGRPDRRRGRLPH
jgi:type VII secretion protein EccE